MMSHELAFDILVSNAREAHEEATRILATALARRQDSESKHRMLQNYRNDYLGRANQGLPVATNVHRLARIGAFLAKLDEAITQQSADLALHDESVRRARAQVLEAERKLKSLEVYLERKAQAAALTERRRDQKTMDEYAARAAQRATRQGGHS